MCDMNSHPSHACGIVEQLAPLLHPGAALVLTIKLVEKGFHNSERLEKEVRAQLQAGGLFEGIELRWLLANGRHERTLFGRRK
jgi:hypothetical protein